MPITITLPPPGDRIGPGFNVRLSSDFIGPFPAGSFWHLFVGADPEGNLPMFHTLIPVTQHQVGFTLGKWNETVLEPGGTIVVAPNPVYVLPQITGPVGEVIDSGASLHIPLDTTTQMWEHANQNVTSGTGGFTTADRQLLTDTERRSQVIGEPVDLTINTPSGLIPSTLARLFGRSWLNNLVLEERTAGETCDPVEFAYNEWYAGVAIRITTIAPDLTPKTPDQDWYFPDLAVLRLFRGDLLRYRRGIHTPTFVTDEPYEWGWNIRNFNEWLGGPPATTVRVDWREGCCGRVYLVRIP